MATNEELFAALDRAGVRFVLVGGVAVVAHGYARLTVDIDLVVDLEPDAARRAMHALVDIGLEPRLPVDAQGFAHPETRRSWITDKGMKVFTMLDPADPVFELDVFVESPLPFEELVNDAKLVTIGGRSVRVASINHLIQMKRAAGRAKDFDDIAELELLRGD